MKILKSIKKIWTEIWYALFGKKWPAYPDTVERYDSVWISWHQRDQIGLVRCSIWRDRIFKCMVVYALYLVSRDFYWHLQEWIDHAFLVLVMQVSLLGLSHLHCWYEAGACITPDFIYIKKAFIPWRKKFSIHEEFGFEAEVHQYSQAVANVKGGHVYTIFFNHLRGSIRIANVYSQADAADIVKRLRNVSSYQQNREKYETDETGRPDFESYKNRPGYQ